MTRNIAGEVDGTVWTYVGRPEATARYHQALQANALVLDQAYVDSIEVAFTTAGLPYEAKLPATARLMRLKRVDT